MKFLRFFILGALLLAGLPGSAVANDAAVVINEVHYHPVVGDTEWIELHSLSGVDIDLSGWKLTSGVDYTFAEGTKIAGHGYLLVAANPSAASLAGLGAVGPWIGALNNSGDNITLVNRDGREMDSLSYSDGGVWPAGADGSGATLARRNSESANPDPSSWATSADAGGTPGRANFAVNGQGPAVSTPSDFSATWKYFVGTPPAGFEQTAFDDSAWLAGPSLLYSGTPTLAGGGDGLTGYWPLDSIAGAQTANLAQGGAAATVIGSPTIVNDPTRGTVIQFTGGGQCVNAGSAIVPQMTLTNDFTWAFWANSTQAGGSNVMVGNRYSPTSGVEWNPLEFIKFTPSQFEYYHNNGQNGIDYLDLAANNQWMHHAVVKSGSTLSYYRNGALTGTTTMVAPAFGHPQPLYFGGDQANESWSGKLDDVAIWTKALTGGQILTLANNTANPLNATGIGTLRTSLGAATTYGFRRAFTFTGTPSRTSASLILLVEDGCTAWLNGTQVYSQNDPATAGTATANLSVAIPIPSSALLHGNNVLAVRVSTFASDPDMVFGAQLTLSETAPTPADQVPGLVFNEISAGGPGFRLELANTSASALNLAGYQIRSSSGAGYLLSGTLNAGAYLTLTAAQIGFTPVSGDKLFLFKADGVALADAREVTGRLRGLSGQYPGRWLFPTSATFGSTNAFTFSSGIVINEIMAAPRPLTQTPFAADPEQWVELYNRSASPVVLTGWSFGDGITFNFAAGTTLPAGGYLVVSNNAAALQAKWPAVASRIVGNFSGSIKRGGEHLELDDANGNPVNEVAFATDAPWPLAKGTGSSLELRDPRADNNRPEAWAASDEAYRGSWQNYTFTAPATPGVSNDPTAWNEFVFGLLGAGSMLIDDISVKQGAIQLIKNGTFETDTSSWRFLGTHARAVRVADPFGTGNVLRVDATDACEHMHNHCETTLQTGFGEYTINSALTYTVSFRARWVSGANLLNSRLYFDRIAHTSVLPVAAGGGTPGAANTSLIANLGPTFSGLTHAPAVPAANQAATVSVTAADPDGLGVVTLFYAVNGGSFVSLAMTPQGAGKFAASIPGQNAGVKVQFYVQAADTPGALGFAPAGGANSRAIIPWDDGQARLTLNGVQPNNVRIVMKDTDVTTLHTPTNVMSNDRMGCTVIWNERDVHYDSSVHLHGSERGRNQPLRVSYNLRFPQNNLLLGAVDAVVVDRSGAGNQSSEKEILIKRAILHAGGLPGSEDDLCRVIAPQSAQTGPAIFGRQRIVSGEYLDSAYASGSDGDLFKYELIYYPTTNVINGNRQSLKLPEPDDVAGVNLIGLGTDQEAYRWHWLISNLEEKDDYSGLMTFLTAFGRSPAADAQYFIDTNAMMDVSEWLRAFAIETLFGIGDNYATGSQHNFYNYRRPADGRWIFLPYDMDFTFNNDPSSTMFPSPDLAKLVSTSQTQGVANLRTYWAHVYDLCQTSFSSAYLTSWAQHYNNFVAEDLTQYMSYVNTRRAYALGQLGSAIPSVPFAITTPSGSAPVPTVTIAGNAWVDVAQMRLAGSSVPLAVSWTSTTAWQTSISIGPGANLITINAFNSTGVQIGSASVTITGTGSIVPADASNLVISEIMYHPGPPTTAEIAAGYNDAEAFEFLELQNISATTTVSLANCSFTAGISMTLPNTTLAPGARALVVGNTAAFAQRYGGGFTILGGSFQPGNFLANDGDHITLLDAHGLAIRDFDYNDHAPWPESPDGGGFSLVLINPASNPDHANPLNWRASVALNGNPGTGDTTTFTGNALGDDNGDGVVNLIQYALAGATPFTSPFAVSDGSFLMLSFRRNLAADDTTVTVQRSTDLVTWTSGADVAPVSEEHNADGTATYTWRSTHVLGETAREFLRLRVTKP